MVKLDGLWGSSVFYIKRIVWTLCKRLPTFLLNPIFCILHQAKRKLHLDAHYTVNLVPVQGSDQSSYPQPAFQVVCMRMFYYKITFQVLTLQSE